MRKTIAIIAAAIATLGAFNSVASAEVSYWSTTASNGPDGQHCATSWQTGSLISSNVYFIDGCTTWRIPCPTMAGAFPRPVIRCRVAISADIETYNYMGAKVTMNAKLRSFSVSGATTWIDRSCAGVNHCAIGGPAAGYLDLKPGDSATTQCNGTKDLAVESARDHCAVLSTITTEQAGG
jgi:hypothetical protein